MNAVKPANAGKWKTAVTEPDIRPARAGQSELANAYLKKLLCTARGCTASSGTREHSYFPHLDGTGWSSDGGVRRDSVGIDFHPGTTGVFRTVSGALGATRLSV